MAKRNLLAGWVCAMGVLTAIAAAQTTQSGPVTDSSSQSSPLNAPARGPVVDSANQASPVSSAVSSRTAGVPSGEAIAVHLQEGIDSGRLKNGQHLRGTLDAPLHRKGGANLPAGTAVSLTVIETVPAGRLSAAGEFSLQLLRVGDVAVFTDTLTFRGKPGHRDLPDSAPAVGTDAGLPAGAKLTFHVQPPPAFDARQGSNVGVPAGSVTGEASGQAPPANAAGGQFQLGGSTAGSQGKSGQVQPVQPANNTPQPAQNLGRTSVAPNQPTTPSQPPNSAHPQ